MSFSSKVKEEIIYSTIKNSCCRRALLHGVIASKAFLEDGMILISIENEETASYLKPLIKEFFSRDAFTGVSPKGGRRRFVSFKSNSCEKYLTDILSGSGKLMASKCASCNAYFLKGVFLASGRASDPQKQYCLEFSLGNRAELFIQYFNDLGLPLRARERAGEKLVYTKNSATIEDFFANAEIQSAAFEIINVMIAKEFVNNANRGRNVDTVNIRKAVVTGNEQAVILSKLEDRGLLTQLPEDLYRTARLRLEHPDFSLNQLAIHSVPPLTKSGLVHRLSRIMKIAKELLNN